MKLRIGKKERPILFSGQMVRAILDGRKTQTRRIVKPQFSKIWGEGVCKGDDFYSVHVDILEYGGAWKCIKCPFGKVGDSLWVREMFALDDSEAFLCRDGLFRSQPFYRADFDNVTAKEAFTDTGNRWKPSIHMPRWVSRITLEITGIKVERLQDISEADAKAEGVDPYRCPIAESLVNAVGGMKPIPYTSGFANLWNSINGPDSWSANPWVWVVEFERVFE